MTEPLFLALLIWMTLLTMECVRDACGRREGERAEDICLAGDLRCGVTRYDAGCWARAW